jgi:hypothetical protein
LLGAIGLAVKAFPVTEERREDLLFSLRTAIDQGYLRIDHDSESLYALDSSIKWHASDADVLGRAAYLVWRMACLAPIGERVVGSFA